MYGLPHAGKIAHDELVSHMKPYGYAPTTFTPGLWHNSNTGVYFTLVVDDFGIEYITDSQVDHLIKRLKKKYEISTDWPGLLYCGISLNWNYKHRYVDCSMPKMIKEALKSLKNEAPKRLEQKIVYPNTIQYGAKIQTITDNPSKPLNELETKRIQIIVGIFLYYARILDCTILEEVNNISIRQALATERIRILANQLLDYAYTHPIAILSYRKSDMILKIHSDVSHLSVPKVRSKVGGYFFFRDNIPTPQTKDNNGSVHNECSILKIVTGSELESELGGLYVNVKKGIIIITASIELGWPQPPTPTQTDKTTENAITHNDIYKKRSRTFDMRFH